MECNKLTYCRYTSAHSRIGAQGAVEADGAGLSDDW